MTDANSTQPAKIEFELEALRGFAALMVVVSHIISYGKFIDPGYFPERLTGIYEAGHEMVLIFFVLSGFVIAISTKQNLTTATIPTYLKKRFIRIYPIYLLALIATLLISSSTYSFYTIISNLTFTNVFFSNVILDNGPIWSLHYEVIFYLLFVPISYYNINPLKLCLFAFSVGLINFFFLSRLNFPSLTSYCYGFTFWLSGVVIARYFLLKQDTEFNYRKLMSFLFLLLTIPYFNSFFIVLEKLSRHFYGRFPEFPYDGNISRWFKIAFKLLDFSYLPYCFVAVLVFINLKFRYRNVIILLLQILPAFAIFYLIRSGAEAKTRIVPLSCYAISWLLFFPTFSKVKEMSAACIKFLIWIGGVSYALYILHIPLLILFNKIHVFSGSMFSYIARIVLYITFAIIISYLVEKHLQTWIRKKFLKKSYK